MKRVALGRVGLAWLAGLHLLGATTCAQAPTVGVTTETAEEILPEPEKPIPGKSEYARRIAARNAFGLVDPAPPPPPPPEPVPPPVPPKLNTVQLTGFSRWGGERKVYLVVTKQGAKAPDYMDLREGDERSDIRVVSIDDKNETAVILNAGTEQNLNFKDNGMKPVGGAVPGAPGPAPNMAVGNSPVPPPPVVNTANRFGASGPTVVQRGGVVDSGYAAPQPGNFGGQPQPVVGAPTQAFNVIGGNTGNNNTGNTTPVLPPSMGQNPSINRSRVFNIPPPPLPPVDITIPGQ